MAAYRQVSQRWKEQGEKVSKVEMMSRFFIGGGKEGGMSERRHRLTENIAKKYTNEI